MSDPETTGEVIELFPADKEKGPYNLEEVTAALVATVGNISAAARQLGRSRSKLKAYIDKTPDLVVLLGELRDVVLDEAESNFHRAVFTGDLPSSKFVLQTLGKSRGYTTGAELTGKDGAPLQPKADNKLDVQNLSDEDLEALQEMMERNGDK